MMFIAITCGLWAVLFSRIMIQPYEVFSWWPLVVRFLVSGSSKIQKPNALQAYLYQPLYKCAKCGAFWWLVLFFACIGVDDWTKYALYGPWAIVTAFLLDAGYDYLENKGIA